MIIAGAVIVLPDENLASFLKKLAGWIASKLLLSRLPIRIRH